MVTSTGSEGAMDGVVVVATTRMQRFVVHPLRTHWKSSPAFLLVFVLYVIIGLSVNDVHHVFMRFGRFALSATDFLWLLSGLVAVLEVLRISHPGKDNTDKALAMAGVAIFMAILFVIGVVIGSMGGSALGMFITSGYVGILILSTVQSIVAFKVNSRTLMRTIDNTTVAPS